MATFNNGESGLSVRNKLNTIINKVEGASTIDNDINVDGVNLSAISESISDTAVDIFVYDTRKDSDGGAWRKRTQGTSWYNETLNTAKRGSRKEFPAVAVIVAEADTVTIYDGDDPNLPMWMVFDTISNSILRGSANDVNSAVAGEAQLLIGAIDSSGLYQIDFLKDRGTRWSNANTTNTGVFHLTIAERSGVAPISIAQSPQLIVNGNVNDVAMTVMPNAPIDAATGLPVPTIAVATDGGVSVIKDDGTVVDIVYSGSPAITSVDASPKRMIFSATNGVVFASGYPTADVSSSSFSTLAGLLPDGAGYYSTTIPAVLGTVSKVAA